MEPLVKQDHQACLANLESKERKVSMDVMGSRDFQVTLVDQECQVSEVWMACQAPKEILVRKVCPDSLDNLGYLGKKDLLASLDLKAIWVQLDLWGGLGFQDLLDLRETLDFQDH